MFSSGTPPHSDVTVGSGGRDEKGVRLLPANLNIISNVNEIPCTLYCQLHVTSTHHGDLCLLHFTSLHRSPARDEVKMLVVHWQFHQITHTLYLLLNKVNFANEQFSNLSGKGCQMREKFIKLLIS